MVAARRPPRRWTLAVLLLAFVVLAAVGSVARFSTDLMWFREVDKVGVFWGQLSAKLRLGLLAGVTTGAVIGFNLWLVEHLSLRYGLAAVARPQVERYRVALTPYLRPLRFGVAAFVGLVVGLQASGSWDLFVLWRNAVPFGTTDAQFDRDLGFYVFALPFLRAVFAWLFTTLVITTLLVAAGHYVLGGIRPSAESDRVAAPAQSHLLVLLGAIVALKAWGYWLDRYELVFSDRGTATGASYTDVHAQLPALQVLFWVALVCAALFLWGARSRGVAAPVTGVLLLGVVSVVIGGLYPAFIQRFRVEPQERERERPYIQRNIEATRAAFQLGGIEARSFSAEGTLTDARVEANRATINNVRVWEPSVLQQSIQSLKAIGQWYEFHDVDVDRYPIDGELRQVMIAARELEPSHLQDSAKTWQNLHLAYTHGYGVVAVQVNTATDQGAPEFVVGDFNLEDAEIPVRQPRIYFGELSEDNPDFVIAGSRQAEIDVPAEAGEGTATFRYDGSGGIELSSIWRRLAFAVRFRDVNLLISSNVTSDSRLMFDRDVSDRVEKVAPFLQWDADPYVAVIDGRIVYIRDGYTTTDMYPYSQRIDLAEAARLEGGDNRGVSGRANYIRNSVKAVVDAYDGTVTLYAFDESDPVLAAWRNAFPDLFEPRSAMPDALVPHLRYPEDLFSVQTERYAAYHMSEANDFYSKKDLWQLPADVSGRLVARQEDGAESVQLARRDQPRAMRPYYLLTRLPGEEAEQFIMAMPFTPNNKQNMVSYLAASSDPGSYGEITLFDLPRSRTIVGPTQVNAQILNDPSVARELALLNEGGSTVTMGNLLTIPIEDSLLHVQPIFVQANQNAIPELRRVAVFVNDRLGYAATLEDALGQALSAGGREEPDEPSPPPTTTPPGATEDVAALLRQAEDKFKEADEALRAGKLAEYQRAVDEARRLIQQAIRAAGDTTTPPSG